MDDQRADVPVLGVRQQWKPSDTYNFCVPGLHTYFVVIGGKPVLVHNADMFPVTNKSLLSFIAGARRTRVI